MGETVARAPRVGVTVARRPALGVTTALAGSVPPRVSVKVRETVAVSFTPEFSVVGVPAAFGQVNMSTAMAVTVEQQGGSFANDITVDMAPMTVTPAATGAGFQDVTVDTTFGPTTTATIRKLPVTDNFDGTTLDPAWKVRSGQWTVGSGLLAPNNTSNAHIVRTLPDGPYTSLSAEVTATAAPERQDNGIGVAVLTSPAMALESSSGGYVIYATTGRWRIKKGLTDITDVTTGSFALPLRTRIEVSGGAVRFFVNGTQVHSVTDTTPVYGVGVYQNLGDASNRVDSVATSSPPA